MATCIRSANHNELIGLTKIQIKESYGQQFNDINSNVWMFRLTHSFNILEKNYLYVFFIDDKVVSFIKCRFKKRQINFY